MSEAITVIYRWTANEGMLDQLTSIYRDVAASMEANEPGASAVHIYVSEDENALYVRDEFVNAEAVGYHLGVTAAAHFDDLLAIATPGPFFFFGDVPESMKDATRQMNLGAEFATHAAGFDR